ncbi:hypothetical protein IMCC20628_01016 [Hoeflea sp. IMCC20628]|uniref:hypothetical protein n=1 Tax=Hoeflea sp. IMCC20628 TaxID=1620421 RepID=UPI00063BE8EE|nr:hypothetical protein [Hoeflea sp. IMCC20628]AKH99733.1 hypothetical protein IMCC20628_01016 [Hoeflea sp. IMCC20628]
MFDFAQIARHARQWRANRKRAAMECMLGSLPVELQKDIGWPAAVEHGCAGRTQSDLHARPMPG